MDANPVPFHFLPGRLSSLDLPEKYSLPDVLEKLAACKLSKEKMNLQLALYLQHLYRSSKAGIVFQNDSSPRQQNSYQGACQLLDYDVGTAELFINCEFVRMWLGTIVPQQHLDTLGLIGWNSFRRVGTVVRTHGHPLGALNPSTPGFFLRHDRTALLDWFGQEAQVNLRRALLWIFMRAVWTAAEEGKLCPSAAQLANWCDFLRRDPTTPAQSETWAQHWVPGVRGCAVAIPVQPKKRVGVSCSLSPAVGA